MHSNNRVLALFSGGLDSVLSILWMKKLGYEVLPVFFESFFFGAENAEEAAKAAGLELKVIDIGEELLEVLKKPRYGFGKNMNPCIDCHSLMFKTAGELLESEGRDFLISGEVLGQRPMSQRLDAMNAVAKMSGFRDLIVRPLSQRLLADTLPIKKGWVKKEEMLDIQGRSRQRQIELAKDFGLKEYSTPGGGCLLTDKGYSERLKDLFSYNMLEGRFIKFLRYGRHFRLSPEVKLIIGRNEQELEKIFRLVEDETVIKAADCLGPVGVINKSREMNPGELHRAAELVLSYTNKAKEEDTIAYGLNNDLQGKVKVHKLSRSKIDDLLIKSNT
jgi:tRNA U34 2-thiouridine synthase MnmA/TrmU